MKRQLFLLALAGVTSIHWAFAQATAAPAPAKPATSPAKPANPAPATGPAAEVNGEVIQMDDLNRMVASIKASDPSFQTDSEANRKAISDVRSQLLEELIANKLLYQEAKKQKVAVDPKDVDGAVKQIKDAFKSEADFNTWLKNDGQTVADLQSTFTEELARRAYAKKITADVTVSGDDMGAYYRAHMDDFTIPEGVHVRHILLAINPNAPATEKERVKKRATDLIKQLKGGGLDFATAARNNSDDQGTKSNGGDLGSFARGASGLYSQAFEDAAFAGKEGDVVGPIQTDFGIHIIKIEKKIPSKVMPLKDLQDDPRFKAIVLKDKLQKVIDDKITALKAAAKIKRYI